MNKYAAFFLMLLAQVFICGVMGWFVLQPLLAHVMKRGYNMYAVWFLGIFPFILGFTWLLEKARDRIMIKYYGEPHP